MPSTDVFALCIDRYSNAKITENKIKRRKVSELVIFHLEMFFVSQLFDKPNRAEVSYKEFLMVNDQRFPFSEPTVTWNAVPIFLKF